MAEDGCVKKAEKVDVAFGPRKRKERNVVLIEKIETEADRQLKELVKRQTEVKPSLEQNLKQQKEFTAPSVYAKPCVRGILSYEEFQRLTDRNKRVEELRGHQLSHEEIGLVVDHEFNEHCDEPPEKRRRPVANPEIHQTRLQEIYTKIEAKEKAITNTNQFQKLKHLTRHELQLEKTLLSNSKNSNNPLNKLILQGNERKHAESDRQDSPVVIALRQIEERVAKATAVEAQVARATGVELQAVATTAYRDRAADTDMGLSSDSSTLSNQSSSAGDSTESASVTAAGTENTATTCRSCCAELRQQSSGVVCPLCKEEWQIRECCRSCHMMPSDNTRRQLNEQSPDNEVAACAQSLEKNIVLSSAESIPESALATYRLSSQQIRQLPRFQDYEPGEPNKTLYLKNLSSKVVDTDLPALFMRYERQGAHKIIYKLLKGRMRGQAFVTFPDTETATQALQLVNGFDFKGKPIIIQYAKKH